MTNGNPTQSQQQVPATHPFSITLEAQQWNGVMAALAETPYRIAAPLIQAISEQLQQQVSSHSLNGQSAGLELPQ